MKKYTLLLILFAAIVGGWAFGEHPELPYPIVDTGQALCYDTAAAINPPDTGSAYDGQDAQYRGNPAAYRDNDDGTVTDLVTGLMWVRARGDKCTWDEAMAGAEECRVGGYDDWRMPTIKELYSLIDFRGRQGFTAAVSVPYLDTKYFEFHYGDESAGNRLIDCQDWSATCYIGTTMGGNPTAFGVNFADGRIKGYPRTIGANGQPHRIYVRYVRGNPAYGHNDFLDNSDSTVTDAATGLTWMQADSGRGMDWPAALAYVRGLNASNYLGYDDWRLPNIKELQSIADYTRIPAIDPIFGITRLSNGEYPYYWSSTTHLDNMGAAYLAVGRGLGYMHGTWQDVHGAGAQRSDPKTGDPTAYPEGKGPQGDDIRIMNYVRAVRGGAAERITPATPTTGEMTPLSAPGHRSEAPGRHGPPSEAGERPPAGGGGGWIARLDRDGDQRVSPAEFDGPADGFSRFDRDRDGFISADEAPTGPPARQR